MAGVPNPLNLVRGQGGPPAEPAPPGSAPTRYSTLIGGRHGSPSVNVAFPFSAIKVDQTDPEVRDAAIELASLVDSLATTLTELITLAGGEGQIADGMTETVEEVRQRALELRDRLVEEPDD
jgi:hypothetical protein